MDSDFSIDEDDEPITDNEAGDEPKRRKKKVVTRSYKEPPSKQAASTRKVQQRKKVSSKSQVCSNKKRSPEKKSFHSEFRKSLRKSTNAKSAATQHRILIRNEAEKMKPKTIKADERMPTQEELLEEAAQTEKENLKSLEKFRRMELEKKKVRPTKGTAYTGPVIRYQSISMPCIQDEQKSWEQSTEETEETKRTTRRSRMAASDAAKLTSNKNRCERTFITFENDINNKAFESIFPTKEDIPKRSTICPITKLPARYFDPITQLPYHNIMAFKILRESYYQLLETKADQSDEQVLTWLKWRKKIKLKAKLIKSEQ